MLSGRVEVHREKSHVFDVASGDSAITPLPHWNLYERWCAGRQVLHRHKTHRRIVLNCEHICCWHLAKDWLIEAAHQFARASEKVNLDHGRPLPVLATCSSRDKVGGSCRNPKQGTAIDHEKRP